MQSLCSVTFVVVATLLGVASAEQFCFVPEGQANGRFDHQVCIDTETGETKVNQLPDGNSFSPGIFTDINNLWLIVCGALVLFMQTGFSMLEAGAVRLKNSSNIIFKNLMDSCIGGIVFWLVGYAFAYGGDNDNVFIGSENFALGKETGNTYAMFFFQFVFAATAATIVSGSVAERCRLQTYLVYTCVLSGLVYPVVVHWVWDAQGWLSAFSDTPLFSRDRTTSTGMIDFAGSGVVHMVGGFAGLVGAIALGPRLGRFDGDGKPVPTPGHNILLQSLGTAILWFGWIGFNSGSTLAISNGTSVLAGKVAASTTIASCTGGLAGACVSRLVYKTYDISVILNSILGALVSITAGCAVVSIGSAALIGAIGSLVYVASSLTLLRFQVDDPLDASSVHGFCGLWGVLSVGIFGTSANSLSAGYSGAGTFSSGEQILVQLVGACAIVAWTVSCTLLVFYGLKYSGIGIRVPKEDEQVGLDFVHHRSEFDVVVVEKEVLSKNEDPEQEENEVA